MKKVVAMLIALILVLGSVSALAYDQTASSADCDVIFRVTTGYTWVLPDPEPFVSDKKEMWDMEYDMGLLEVKDLSLWPGQTLNFYLSSKNNFRFVWEDYEGEVYKDKGGMYFYYNLYLGENSKERTDPMLRAIKEWSPENPDNVEVWGPQPVVFGSQILDKNGYLVLKVAPAEDQKFWKDNYSDYEGEDLMYKVLPDWYVDPKFSEHLWIAPVDTSNMKNNPEEVANQMDDKMDDALFTEGLTIYAITQDLPEDGQFKGATNPFVDEEE